MNSPTEFNNDIHASALEAQPTGLVFSPQTMIGLALPEPGRPQRPQTILLVEDEAFVRKAAAEVLDSAGYGVIVAGGAAEALESCQKKLVRIDLLLTDVVMPGMNGCELAAKFEILFPEARVLLMTGYTDQITSCDLSAYGQTCVAKPFSTSTLLSRVRELLDTNVGELRS